MAHIRWKTGMRRIPEDCSELVVVMIIMMMMSVMMTR